MEGDALPPFCDSCAVSQKRVCKRLLVFVFACVSACSLYLQSGRGAVPGHSAGGKPPTGGGELHPGAPPGWLYEGHVAEEVLEEVRALRFQDIDF